MTLNEQLDAAETFVTHKLYSHALLLIIAVIRQLVREI